VVEVAVTAVYLCECKHAKGVHQGMTYWCREDACNCKRYTPDFQTAAIVARAQAEPDQPALSAQLARVEQERDELAVRAADLEQVREELKQVRTLAGGYLDDIQHLESGQDEVIGALRTQRDAARAELASARAELEQLRNRGAVIAQHVRYLCETCGSRYGIDYTDHTHGPLTPVVVTITRQGGQDG
jgi:hypothetical protein